MATATESSEEDSIAGQKVLEEKIDELRSAKKELFEKARPINDQLETIAQRERQYVDELRRLRVDEHDKKTERVAVKRAIQLEAELKRVIRENDKLKQSLDQATEHSKVQFRKIAELENGVKSAAQCKTEKISAEARVENEDCREMVELRKRLLETTKQLCRTKGELNETRRRLSDVQERLTVAEQVTAATQQRALQETANSEDLQLQLTLQRHKTTHTGRPTLKLCIDNKYMYATVHDGRPSCGRIVLTSA